MSDRTRKPLLRPRNIVLAALLVGVSLLGYAIVTATTATPGNAVDYQQKVVDLVEGWQKPASGPPAPNAWPVLMEAIAKLSEIEDAALKAAGGRDAQPADWPQGYGWPMDYSSIRDARAPVEIKDRSLAVIEQARAAGVFDRLATLAQSQRIVRPKQDGQVLSMLLPELGRGRSLARMGAARMFVAHGMGNSRELVESFEQTLALGRAFCMQFTLIDRLVGIAIIALAGGEVRTQLTAAPPDAATCRALLAALDRQTATLPPIAMQFEGERLGCLDTIQWTHSDDGHGDGRLLLTKMGGLSADVGLGVPTGLRGYSIINVAGFVFPSKKETTARANEFYDGIIAISKLRPDSPPGAPGANFNPDQFIDSLPRGYILLRQLLPAFSRALQSDRQIRGDIAGTRLMLALEIYRAEHGEYPEKLAQLVPSVLPAAPPDGFGRPLGYRRLAKGEDPSGRAYLVYSLGADGNDDGGTPATKSVYDALNSKSPGTDFIYNTPRE